MKILIEGKKINLRKFISSDAEDIYLNVKDKEIAGRAWKIPYPYPKSAADEFINYAQRMLREKRAYILGIEFKENKKIIGVISINNIDSENKKALLGYWLGKKYWGTGIMTEALGLILKFAFDDLNLHRVESQPFETNLASRRILEKNGFVYEGTDREVKLINKKWINVVRYGILEGEYKDKR